MGVGPFSERTPGCRIETAALRAAATIQRFWQSRPDTASPLHSSLDALERDSAARSPFRSMGFPDGGSNDRRIQVASAAARGL